MVAPHLGGDGSGPGGDGLIAYSRPAGRARDRSRGLCRAPRPRGPDIGTHRWPHNRILIWLVFGLGTMLSTGLTRPEATDTSPLTPPVSWRRDQTARLVAGLAGGVMAGLLVGLLWGVFTWSEGLEAVLEQALIPCLLFGLTAGLLFGLTHAETWPVSLTFIQLTRRQHTPIHLMRLLEDARERQILRTVGPVYQFRHARLQDRLADQA